PFNRTLQHSSPYQVLLYPTNTFHLRKAMYSYFPESRGERPRAEALRSHRKAQRRHFAAVCEAAPFQNQGLFRASLIPCPSPLSITIDHMLRVPYDKLYQTLTQAMLR